VPAEDRAGEGLAELGVGGDPGRGVVGVEVGFVDEEELGGEFALGGVVFWAECVWADQFSFLIPLRFQQHRDSRPALSPHIEIRNVAYRLPAQRRNIDVGNVR